MVSDRRQTRAAARGLCKAKREKGNQLLKQRYDWFRPGSGFLMW